MQPSFTGTGKTRSGENEPRSFVRILSPALGVAAASAIATGAALAAFVAKLNDWGFGRDFSILFAYLTALYAVVYVAGLGSAALVGSLMGRRDGPRLFVALAIGFAVFLTSVLRFNPAIQLASVVPSLNWMGVIDLVTIGLATVAVVAAITFSGWPRRLAAFAVALLCLVGLHFLHLWHESPLRRDLVPMVATSLDPDRAPTEPEALPPFEGARLVVLGFDGLSWENLLPLMRRGDLPNFSALMEGAAYGYLETLPFAVSPVVWETINSGRSPDQHGIGHHIHFDFPGLGQRVARLPGLRLCNTPMGLRRLLVAAAPFAPWSTVTASGLDSRAARLWEIASKHDIRVGIFNWYNLGPAVPVLGFLRSQTPFQPANHPVGLEEGFPPLPPQQDFDPRTRASGGAKISERERALWHRFVEHATRHRAELLMYYTHYADGVNHVNWKYELVGPSLFYSGWRHPDFEPGPMITAAHQLLDEIVGDVVRRTPEDATIVVLSDHGFDFRGYEHDNAPPGVIIARGAQIEPGLVEGASVYDMAPTLLHLLGLPAAGDMPGSVLAAVRGERAERVASYGDPIPADGDVTLDDEDLAREKAYLKSLGYVVD